MKTMKLLLGLALIVAVASPAWAITFNTPYAGPISINLVNRDEGTFYPLGSNASGEDAVDNIVGQIPGNNTETGEDAWGIFRVTSIQDDSANVIWSTGTAGKDLFGVFYGLTDVEVETTVDTVGNPAVAIESVGLTFDLWEVPVGTPFPADDGPGARMDEDEFAGITDVPGAVLALRATSRAPVAGQPEYRSLLTIIDGVFATGEFDAFADVVGGRDLLQFDNDGQFGGTDMFLQGDLFPGSDGWSFNSSDPVRTDVRIIPEPMTMGAFGMAIAGLGGYIRRRRR